MRMARSYSPRSSATSAASVTQIRWQNRSPSAANASPASASIRSATAVSPTWWYSSPRTRVTIARHQRSPERSAASTASSAVAQLSWTRPAKICTMTAQQRTKHSVAGSS